MPKPTQTQLKAAAIDMLKDALGELDGALDVELEIGLGSFTSSQWHKCGLRPYSGPHEKDECAFWIDNPHERHRPILVKVSVPQTGQIGE